MLKPMPPLFKRNTSKYIELFKCFRKLTNLDVITLVFLSLIYIKYFNGIICIRFDLEIKYINTTYLKNTFCDIFGIIASSVTYIGTSM